MYMFSFTTDGIVIPQSWTLLRQSLAVNLFLPVSTYKFGAYLYLYHLGAALPPK